MLWATVEAPTPPLAPTTAMMRPTGLASGAENRPHTARTTCNGADRRDQIIADAAPHQLAIERDVVHAPDDDDPRAGIADLGELIEAVEDIVAAAFRFEHDDVRRRRALIGFDGRGQAAHLDAQMRLGQAPIFAGRLNGRGGLDRLAERLHRNARRRRDVLVAPDESRRAVSAAAAALTGFIVRPHHLPTSLILLALVD